MNDRDKTKEQLLEQLQALQLRVSELERTEQATLFQRFAEASGQGHGMADLEGRITYANLALCEALGERTPQDAVGKNVRDYYPDDSQRKLAQEILPAVTELGQWVGELPILSRNGQLIPAIQSLFLIRDEKGEPLCIANVITDITERKQAEDALRESHDELERRVEKRTEELRRANTALQAEIAERRRAEEELRRNREHLEELVSERTAELKESEKKFRALADSTTAAIAITLGDGDRFVYANKTMLDNSGMTWDQLSQISPTDTLPPKASEAGLRAGMEARARGKSRFRFEVQLEDGMWIEVNASRTDVDGEEAWIWTSFDITDHKRAQEALKRSEDKYRAIFETTGTSTISFDNDALITLANEEFAALSGYSREEIEGKMTWMTFFTEESLRKMKKYHELRGKDPSAVPRTYEAQLQDRDGRVHDGIITISMVPGTTQRVGSFLDYTELKRAQQQMYRADKMAALGQIIAGVAHEINNPNNFIYFNLPILHRYIEAMRPLLEHHLKEQPDLKILNMPYQVFVEDMLKLLENMEHGSQRITSIVSDLKTYIRSDEDQEMHPGGLGKVIEQVMTLVGKQVRKMVKRFEVKIPDSLPPVRMNPGKIEQVLINLVINAGQAADKEDSWIELSARAADQSRFVEILVEDNGTGIPKDSLEQIFEPFYTSKGRDTGTGLGLSISHQIVQEHGGSIEASSEEGKGSCFVVRLPVETGSN